MDRAVIFGNEIEFVVSLGTAAVFSQQAEKTGTVSLFGTIRIFGVPRVFVSLRTQLAQTFHLLAQADQGDRLAAGTHQPKCGEKISALLYAAESAGIIHLGPGAMT